MEVKVMEAWDLMVTCMMEKGFLYTLDTLLTGLGSSSYCFNWQTISAAPQAEVIQLQEVTAELKQFAG